MASVRDEVDLKDKTPAEVEKLLADRGFTKDPTKAEAMEKVLEEEKEKNEKWLEKSQKQRDAMKPKKKIEL